MTDGVVLLHGIFRTRRSMAPLARFLESKGYRVLNPGYPSTRYAIEELADLLHPVIERFAAELNGKLHFMGYSMGGLLARAYIHRYKPAKLGRLLLIGTPNGGSEVADFIQRWPIYKKLYGPAGQQLITNQNAFKHVLGDLACETGCIAGSRTIDPFSSWIIGKPNDGKVSVDSTHVAGQKDHIIIPCSHTFFPANKQMFRQALAFLRDGRFSR